MRRWTGRARSLAGCRSFCSFGAGSAQKRLVVSPPGLVAAAGLAVALDLAVDDLEALADGRRDLLHAGACLQAVGDGDLVILGEERRGDRAGVRNEHPANFQEPVRSQARRHADNTSGCCPLYPSRSSSMYRFLTTASILL